jgi:hypothetical protein
MIIRVMGSQKAEAKSLTKRRGEGGRRGRARKGCEDLGTRADDLLYCTDNHFEWMLKYEMRCDDDMIVTGSNFKRCLPAVPRGPRSSPCAHLPSFVHRADVLSAQLSAPAPLGASSPHSSCHAASTSIHFPEQILFKIWRSYDHESRGDLSTGFIFCDYGIRTC